MDRARHLDIFQSTLDQVESDMFEIKQELGCPVHADDDPSDDLLKLDGQLMRAAAVFQEAIDAYRVEHARLKAYIAADAAEAAAEAVYIDRLNRGLGYGHLQHERL